MANLNEEAEVINPDEYLNSYEILMQFNNNTGIFEEIASGRMELSSNSETIFLKFLILIEKNMTEDLLNQKISSDVKFSYLPTSKTAITWAFPNDKMKKLDVFVVIFKYHVWAQRFLDSIQTCQAISKSPNVADQMIKIEPTEESKELPKDPVPLNELSKEEYLLLKRWNKSRNKTKRQRKKKGIAREAAEELKRANEGITDGPTISDKPEFSIV